MQIKRKDIAKVTDLASQKINEFDITFNPKKIVAFKNALKSQAKNKYTTEGVKLSKDDFKQLKGNIVGLLGDVVQSFAQLNETVRRDSNVKDYLLVGHDYLLSMMAEELNCPEIPRDIFMSLKTDLEEIAERLLETKPEPLDIPQKYFDQQRRMDADVVSGKIENVMKKVQSVSTHPDSKDIGTLYAEYQALSKRQAGHGAFWRLFHGKENEKRMQLLADMRSALEKYIPDYKLNDLATTTPSEIVRYAELRDLNVAIHNDMDSREKNFVKSLENFSPYRAGKFNGTMKDFLKVEYRPTITDLKGEMRQMTKLYNAIKRGVIFKDDKIVNKLITRNYVRLSTAESMAKKNPVEWEKYCANDDENFKSEYNIYSPDGKTVIGTTLVLPDQIPDIPEEPAYDDQKELINNLTNDTSEKALTTSQKSSNALETSAIVENSPETKEINNERKIL